MAKAITMHLWHTLAHVQEQDLQTKTEDADKLRAVLKLESQVESVREHAARHEAELRDELQQVRRDKKELEAKLAGLDLTQMEVQFRNMYFKQLEMHSIMGQQRCCAVAAVHSLLCWVTLHAQHACSYCSANEQVDLFCQLTAMTLFVVDVHTCCTTLAMSGYMRLLVQNLLDGSPTAAAL